MKPQIETGELMQRIRREARRHGGVAFPAADTVDDGDAALPMPPAPALPPAHETRFVCESLLALAGNMINGARIKTTVRKDVPGWLRPFFRNQGGYNDIVLEVLARLREADRHLMTENIQLRLHVERQTEWMQAAERRFARLEKHVRELEEESQLYKEPQDH